MASIVHLVVTAADRTGRALGGAGRSVGRFLRDSDRGFQRFGNRIGDHMNRGLRRGERGIGRTLRGTFVGFGRMISETMADGIGDAFKRAASNPFVAAAIGILAIAVASMLGAALAGALVLAIGGAFVGLGVMMAFQADAVRKKWTDTIKELKPLFTHAADGLVPVIEHVRQKLEFLARQFAPHFADALTAAAPHIQTFFDRLVNGFRILGKKVSGPMEEAFNTFLDALGPELEGMLSGLGDSLAALARTVSAHSSEIAQAFTMVIGLITTAIDIINFFANAWVMLTHSIQAAIGRIIQAMATLVDMSLSAVERILDGFSHIPFIGEQFGKARDAVRKFKDATVESMQRAGQAFIDAGAKADRLNKERRLRVNVASWNAQLAVARANLKRTTDQKAVAKIKADIADLIRKKALAIGMLNGLNGKTATVHINTVYSSENRTRKVGGRFVRATGGNVGIGAATGGTRANMTLVGEHGPELVDFSAGRVHSNNKSRQMVNGGGGGMQPFYVLVDVGGDRFAEVLVDPLHRAVSRRGGVQATFGKL